MRIGLGLALSGLFAVAAGFFGLGLTLLRERQRRKVIEARWLALEEERAELLREICALRFRLEGREPSSGRVDLVEIARLRDAV